MFAKTDTRASQIGGGLTHGLSHCQALQQQLQEQLYIQATCEFIQACGRLLREAKRTHPRAVSSHTHVVKHRPIRRR